jgi:hypothetical protein
LRTEKGEHPHIGIADVIIAFLDKPGEHSYYDPSIEG